MHGSVRCDAGNYYGSACSVDCQEGYEVLRNQTVECTQHAVWSDDLPHCIGMDSNWLTIIVHIYADLYVSGGKVIELTVIIFYKILLFGTVL